MHSHRRRQTDHLSSLSDRITSNNLQRLAKAAQSFHSSASSSAGSSAASSAVMGRLPEPVPHETSSSTGELTPVQVERLRDYIRNTSNDSGFSSGSEGEGGQADVEDWLMQSQDVSCNRGVESSAPVRDVDLKLPLVEVLEDCALEKMKAGDVFGAETFLEQALSGKFGTIPGADLEMRLQTRLAICYVFQGRGKQCEDVIKKLEKLTGTLELEALNLLHAAAINYLSHYLLAEARDACTRALRGKVRLLGKSHPETLETMGLMARIYDLLNEVIHLEAIRRVMPSEFVYCHPPSERDFLRLHSQLLPDLNRGYGGESIMFHQPAESDAQVFEKRRCDLERTISRYEQLHKTDEKPPPSIEASDVDEDLHSDDRRSVQPLQCSLSRSLANIVRNCLPRRSVSERLPGVSWSARSKICTTRTLLLKEPPRLFQEATSSAYNTNLAPAYGSASVEGGNTRTEIFEMPCDTVFELDATPISPPLESSRSCNNINMKGPIIPRSQSLVPLHTTRPMRSSSARSARALPTILEVPTNERLRDCTRDGLLYNDFSVPSSSSSSVASVFDDVESVSSKSSNSSLTVESISSQRMSEGASNPGEVERVERGSSSSSLKNGRSTKAKRRARRRAAASSAPVDGSSDLASTSQPVNRLQRTPSWSQNDDLDYQNTPLRYFVS